MIAIASGAFLLAGCASPPQQRPVISAHAAPRLVSQLFGDSSAPTVGEVLTTTNGTWTNSPTSFAYQWQDCNGDCSSIVGATLTSYTVQSADLGDTIDVVVTASNAAGSASQTSPATGVVTSGGTTPTNCAPVVTTPEGNTTSAQFNWTPTISCGYPAPTAAGGTAGVPAGTVLGAQVSSLNCSSGTITDANFVGSVGNISSQNNCTIQDSRLVLTDGGTSGGFAFPSGMHFLHDEVSGVMTGSNCSSPTGNLIEGSGTISFSYLHCTGEDVNYAFNVDHSVLIADGPPGEYSAGTPHYENHYTDTGSGFTDVDNTYVNPISQVTNIFADTHSGPNAKISNITVTGSLLDTAAHGIDAGCNTLTGSAVPTGLSFTNNRFAYFSTTQVTSGSGSVGGQDTNIVGTGMIWTGNIADTDLSTVSPNPGGAGC